MIKLISPHHSCDNLYKSAVIKYKMCSDKALMNLETGVNNSQPLCKLCIIFRILYRMFPQITGNTILEILDYKIFCGCMSRTPPLPLELCDACAAPHLPRRKSIYSLWACQLCDYETMIVLKYSNSRWCVLALVFLNIMFSGYTVIFIIIRVLSEIILPCFCYAKLYTCTN